MFSSDESFTAFKDLIRRCCEKKTDFTDQITIYINHNKEAKKKNNFFNNLKDYNYFNILDNPL